ncbi:hypothetical protein PMIN04_010136 [Paraphaeosphaeria minitans]
MWGPKAGVRYEGLYRVRGWAVHQPKTSPFHAGQKVRLGDVYFDIHLERCDPVPVQEVAKSPIASELDDYSEYKRLRKVHKDLRCTDYPSASSCTISQGVFIQGLFSPIPNNNIHIRSRQGISGCVTECIRRFADPRNRWGYIRGSKEREFSVNSSRYTIPSTG